MTMFSYKQHFFLTTALAALLACGLPHAHADGKTYHLELPAYKANAGKPLTVPVMLHDASGLARIRLQLNFDQEVIQFNSIQMGPLGKQFDVEPTIDNGTLTLDFTRTENLSSGSGHLVYVKFDTNPGATTDLYSDLTIAKFEIGDSSGLTDLMLNNTVILESGSVHVTLDSTVDNSSNGLPDWWEEAHGLNPFSTSDQADEDGDSIINKFELAFGGDPNASDSRDLLPHGGSTTLNAKDYFSLDFRRRRDGSDGLNFKLYESPDLLTWTEVSIPGLQVKTSDLGGGMEQVTVRSSLPMTGPDSEPKCFLKLSVE